ncbi:cell surface protein [Hanstruepera neustonica]|uniref:Cell surface protein n=1 Tax=Hanstruepera neustonica TaxID=1445657 RepID=A0A2K1DVV6_9FLAO|nr:tetratricopeptide repeat protein [Hanstruepera neustonica]PNQ72178.1 cell surface protein [Hanstruepera neustonica]
MKTTKLFKLGVLICLLCFSSCNKHLEQVTDANTYNTYLELDENDALQIAKNDLLFWEKKLEKEPNQFPYLAKLAACHSQLFNQTGEIAHLIKAESYLMDVNKRTNYNHAGYLRTLARNYISQHRFKEALTLLEKAVSNGENIQATYKMLFDVQLDLGNVVAAKTYLDRIKDLSDFDYLIRLSKWSDHEGNLDAAIKYMEKATAIAESSNISNTKQWAYTNLADFYGHAGNIQKSYDYYLKALKLNPHDAYAKKGIAWIVFSYERDAEEALRILNSVTQSYQTPDLYLLKADILEYLNQNLEQQAIIDNYVAMVSNEQYGTMYNAYNVELYAEQDASVNTALELAKQEISNRPTPQSYDLLAWSYYQQGNVKKALTIMEDFVVGYTFEPLAMYHLAVIYKANGMEDKANALKPDLESSIYELGPLLERDIKNI